VYYHRAMSAGDQRSPFLQAFEVLLTAAEPSRQEQVLRHAITLLLSDNPAPRIFNGPVPTIQPQRWAEVRPRLREYIGREPARRQEVASRLGVSVNTLSRVLGLRSDGPSVQVIANAEAWLEARSVNETKPNGHAPPRQVQPSPAKPDGGDRPLTSIEIDKLQAAAARLSDAGLCDRLKLSRDDLDAALMGRVLPAAIAGKLAGFLR
jgi:transcriptional regulator with XRE-family HTH domain